MNRRFWLRFPEPVYLRYRCFDLHGQLVALDRIIDERDFLFVDFFGAQQVDGAQQTSLR